MKHALGINLCFVFIVAVLLSACANYSAKQSGNLESNQEAVMAVLQAYVAGRQARDIAAVEAVLHEDVDQLTSRGEWRRGIDAATAGMKRSTKTNPGQRTLEVETVRFLTREVALADARYVIAGTNGPDRVLWSSFTLLLGEDGKWRITSIRNQKPAK